MSPVLPRNPDTLSPTEVEPPLKSQEGSQDDRARKLQTRASKLEFKLVEETWNVATHRYETENVSSTPHEIDALDEYVFVVRVRINSGIKEAIPRIEIKSENLRDMLRIVLRDVDGISLFEDKPTLQRNLLYQYLAELKEHRKTADSTEFPGSKDFQHLDLLIDHIEEVYARETRRLALLLECGQITYDLLWLIFKPTTVVYTARGEPSKARCIKCDNGREEIVDGLHSFRISGRCLDSDGEKIGESGVELQLEHFSGSKRINTLDVFPFEYHQSKEATKKELILRGRKSLSLNNGQAYEYDGTAVCILYGRPVETHVNAHIMVDALEYRKHCPNYRSTLIYGLGEDDAYNVRVTLPKIPVAPTEQTREFKSTGRRPKDAEEAELIFCNPTVLGFSLQKKAWAEFTLTHIAEVTWNLKSFSQLAIPSEQKDLLHTVAQAYLDPVSENKFDDFIKGKGQGLIVLLHGPPGIGKTLTAESLSEDLQRPLYSISAGELGTTAGELEDSLSQIFELAKRWKALVLLDEAEVFLQRRSLGDVDQNALVSVFLRYLEYYRGILFLTTNRMQQIDSVILSRIHLKIGYSSLSSAAQASDWKNFLEEVDKGQGSAIYSKENMDLLVKKNLDGRQIKNLVTVVHAVATTKKAAMTMSDLKAVIDIGGYSTSAAYSEN